MFIEPKYFLNRKMQLLLFYTLTATVVLPACVQNLGTEARPDAGSLAQQTLDGLMAHEAATTLSGFDPATKGKNCQLLLTRNTHTNRKKTGMSFVLILSVQLVAVLPKWERAEGSIAKAMACPPGALHKPITFGCWPIDNYTLGQWMQHFAQRFCSTIMKR